MTFRPDPPPGLVLRMFRKGLNSFEIAEKLLIPESLVVRLLNIAREAHHDSSNPSLPPVRKPPLEG